MKKVLRIVLIVVGVAVVIATFVFLYNKSKKEPVKYEIKKARIDNVSSKTVATGSVVPRKEVEVKPQVSGIVDELYVEAGNIVKKDQVLARIKIIPDMVNLNGAESRLNQAKIRMEDARQDYDRQKELFDRKVISQSEFQKTVTAYNEAREEMDGAENNLQLIKEGVTRKSQKTTNTLIRSTIDGMVLDVPIKVGNSVIQANTFNAGTTIATIADMRDMIFLGKIDETEVGKLKAEMPLQISIGAIPDEKFPAFLEYVSPKGVEQNGAIQFEIKANVQLKESRFIRSGYSANADIVLDRKDSVLVVDESIVQFSGDSAFVEVLTTKDPQTFKKQYVKTGLSDGLKIEILEGVTLNDELKGEKIDPKKKLESSTDKQKESTKK